MQRLSDEQWERIREHFPEGHIPSDRRGHKPIPARKVLEAVLWILNTGAQWHMLHLKLLVGEIRLEGNQVYISGSYATLAHAVAFGHSVRVV
ncbi:MAG: transposase [Gammaproteobacteria bacterium]